MRDHLTDSGIGLVIIGFSPPAAMRDLAEYLGLAGPVLCDEQRRVFHLLGLGRAPIWRVYSPGTLARYARAVLRGHRLQRPVEDTRQLGGDAIILDGVITRLWTPRTPDDRVAPRRLVAAARRALDGDP